ncbi:hypothetical protein BKA67DRAFT_682493 [Truncatella angustata]|uniref:RBR-type E3 ubiquitin transferase n=1 Tax=Truncatella angustata TaxID=152316 RepID=A0A9P8RJT5_9PEZI|nr:uncharacterized protein BKA67DRAFT_682493 [Truncatella angustata]KAH6647365.1 hypothetical protein BKA67DRAFT_682493 [Truncatella angustata]
MVSEPEQLYRDNGRFGSNQLIRSARSPWHHLGGVTNDAQAMDMNQRRQSKPLVLDHRTTPEVSMLNHNTPNSIDERRWGRYLERFPKVKTENSKVVPPPPMIVLQRSNDPAPTSVILAPEKMDISTVSSLSHSSVPNVDRDQYSTISRWRESQLLQTGANPQSATKITRKLEGLIQSWVTTMEAQQNHDATKEQRRFERIRNVNGEGKSQKQVALNDLDGITLEREISYLLDRLASLNTLLEGSTSDPVLGARFRAYAVLSDEAHQSWAETSKTANHKSGGPLYEPLTLRQLLLERLYNSGMSCQKPSFATKLVGRNGLDEPLTKREIEKFKGQMNGDYDSIKFSYAADIYICAVCELPKFRFRGQENWGKVVDDFHHTLASCPGEKQIVCRKCYGEAVLQNIYHMWWQSIGNDLGVWMQCPVENCRHPLPSELFQQNTTSQTLKSLLDRNDVNHHILTFSRVIRIREELSKFLPEIDEVGMWICSKLQKRLKEVEHARKLVSARSSLTKVEDLDIKVLPVHHVKKDVIGKVPIFTGLLWKVPKECCICMEEYQEYDNLRTGDSTWKTIATEFAGEWTWQIFHFPTKEILSCGHPFDICRACIAAHIKAQITREGGCVNDIRCPYSSCERVLTHNELQHLASPADFAKYDQLCTIEALTDDKSFVWCLRKGCGSGASYVPITPNSKLQLIHCHECQFRMCFEHKCPWHEGMTCAELVDSERCQESQNWIMRNTKPCPGCNIRIQKGEACFHMRCPRPNCKYEFCWECLADWKEIYEIRSVYGPSYNRQAHRTGCPFRDAHAPMPFNRLTAVCYAEKQHVNHQVTATPVSGLSHALWQMLQHRSSRVHPQYGVEYVSNELYLSFQWSELYRCSATALYFGDSMAVRLNFAGIHLYSSPPKHHGRHVGEVQGLV